jgi:hypothetical protein
VTAKSGEAWHLDPARRKPAFWASRQPCGVATTTMVPAVTSVISVTITAAGQGELTNRLSVLTAEPP